jgi:hypothetical protein
MCCSPLRIHSESFKMAYGSDAGGKESGMVSSNRMRSLPSIPRTGPKATPFEFNEERTRRDFPFRGRLVGDATLNSVDPIHRVAASDAKRSPRKRRLKDVGEKQSPPVSVRRFVLDASSVQRLCTVETVLSDRFTATFSEPGKPIQRVRFDISIVSPNDLPLLKEGATFYWCMGYRQENDGDRAYVSFLRFRRFPRLSDDQVETARRRAADIAAVGGWDLLTNKEVDEKLARSEESPSP